MENASKALIIAGEVLIGVLILTLASYIIVQFGNFSKNLNSQMSASEIRNFNVNFTNFSGRANIRIQEIATIVNFAKQNNDNYDVNQGDNSPFYVDVFIGDNSILNIPINQLLEQNKDKCYSCNVSLSNITIENDSEGKTIISAKRNFYDTDIQYNEKQRTELVNKIIFHEVGNVDYANAILQGAIMEWKN